MTLHSLLRTVYIYILVTIVSTSSFAQSDSDLEKLWTIVQNEYAGIQLHNAAVAKKKLDSIVAASQYWPELHLQYQQSFSSRQGSNGAFYPLPGIFNINAGANLDGDNGTFNSYGSGIVRWDIVHFGRKKSNQSLSSIDILETELEKDKYELLLKKELANRYFNSLYYTQLLDWTNKNNQRLKDILEISKSLSLSGIYPLADTLLASSAYNQIIAQKHQTRGMQNAAYKYLNEFVPNEIDWLIDKNKFENIEFANFRKESILDNHPLIKQSKLKLDRINHLDNLEKGKTLPNISLLGGLSSRTSGIYEDGTVSNKFTNGYNNRANNYFIGAGVTWSLQQALKASKTRKSLQFLNKESALEVEVLQDQLLTQTDVNSIEVKESFEQIKNSKLSVKEAQDAFEMYKIRYEGGLINLSELLQIQGILQVTEKVYLDNLLRFWQLQTNQSYLHSDFTHIFNNF